MYFPIVDYIERIAKGFCRWFLISLFCTNEMQNEVTRFFETGKTSFRFFEWLDVSRLQRLFPNRWKAVLADFAAAYFKLALLSVLVSLACLISIKIL